MKKLAIVLLLVVACRRQVEVGSPTTPNTPGASTPTEALVTFMAAAKAQDLQAMSNIWGSTAGPARATLSREQWEQREIIMMGCLKHDSYRMLGETAAPGGERVIPVELKYRDLTPTTNFSMTVGPSGRWYVKIFEMDPLQTICQAR
ncbi:MAG: hypothetical protein WD801_16125 [Gemmatimonadaceae bacterium]